MRTSILGLAVEPESFVDRLRLAVRAEFDVEVYVPDPDDPVLGGGHCAVGGCDGWKRARGVCEYHHGIWRRGGRPDMEAFVASARPRPHRGDPRRGECFDLSGLPEQLRLEMTYVLQCRKDARFSGLPPEAVHQIVAMLKTAGALSLLERSVAGWRILLANQKRSPARSSMAFVDYAHVRVEDLAVRADATSEYARDVWDLRRLGMPVRLGPYRLRFDGITQPWLRLAVKRWARFRLTTKAVTTVKNDTKAVARFALFLDDHTPDAVSESAITREALESYLPWLATRGLSCSTRMDELVGLRTFIEHTRRHGWLPRLPLTATFYSEDLPAKAKPLPRFLSEFVMAQIESEANLTRLANPSLANLVVILIETGLRVGDATALAFETVVVDSSGWPCLRFLNSKMGAEQLIPLSAKAAAAISAQQDHVRRCWPAGTPPVLFPAATANPDGARQLTVSSVERSLRRWQTEIGLCDENGLFVRATPHQFRHTFGTRTINQGVPQHVVQKLLGHASPEMTATYAHLHDHTVREAFEAYCEARVNIVGEVLPYDNEAPTAGAEWIKHHLARIADALPNGLCGRPPQQECPHPNACLTCPDFQTTPEYLPVHRQQLDTTRRLIATAEANGQFRLLTNHQRVEANLLLIIPALEALEGDEEHRAS